MDKNSTDKHPQNEVALSALRDQALSGLLKEGRESAYTSHATPTAQGLKIETTNDATKQKTHLDVSQGPIYERPTITLGGKMSTDVKVSDGKNTETGHIEFSYGLMQRNDQGHVELTRKDASGKVIQSAVGDYDKFGHNHNANNTTEVDYKIKDARFGEINLNQVVTHQPNGSDEYRSVIRDNNNKVLGIIDQNFTTDAQGNLQSVTTEARKSKYQGQIKPPTE